MNGRTGRELIVNSLRMKRTDIPEEPDLCRQAPSLFLSFLVCLILLKCELSVSKPPLLLSHFLFPTPPWSCFRIKPSGLDVPTGARPATTLSPGLWPRTCPQQLPVSPWKQLALVVMWTRLAPLDTRQPLLVSSCFHLSAGKIPPRVPREAPQTVILGAFSSPKRL